MKELKREMLEEPRYASIEQALIITKAYQAHEGESKILKRAYALYDSLTQIKIRIEPTEKIVGNRTSGVRAGVVFPESGISWVEREIETLPTRVQDRFEVRAEDIETFRSVIVPYWKGHTLEDQVYDAIGAIETPIKKVVKINQKDHAQGHINPNCELWLSKGPKGILEDAKQHLLTCTEEQRDYYQATEIVYEGVLRFIERYRDLALEMAQTDVENHDNLQTIAKNCDAILCQDALNFHQAVQSLWFLFVILHMESNASSFSPGRMDQYLYPFYQQAIQDGVSNQEIIEILCGFWLKCNQIVYMRNKEGAKYFAGFPIGFNIALSGKDIHDQDMTNELSYLCLKVQEWVGLPQPNLSVRLHANTPVAFLKETAKVIGKGSGMPQVFNDESIIPAMMKKGISKEDAYNYCIVGCVELTTSGNNLGWSDAAMFNLVKVLELTLNHGKCLLTNEQIGLDLGDLTTYETYEQLEDAFAEQMQYFVSKMIDCCAIVDRLHGEIVPSVFLSGVIDSCMEKGLDVTQGGAHYNLSGIQAIQVANIADCFAVLKQMVFEQQKISKQEMLDALHNNFEDEVLRQTVLNKVPKYGNDVEWVDAIGQKWVKFFADELSKYTNVRGGIYHAGLYTVSAHVPMGHNLGASCDGRHALDPLADGGMSAVYGRDVNGPTALLRSVSRIDGALGTNGTLLNMKFLPSVFQEEETLMKFVGILRAIVKLGINHSQFNVVNREDLLAAKAHPDQYKSLTIRVAGYTAYFVELAPDLQDEIIARTEYQV
ncbi:MAG: formate C-acetyltransferase/glycerol dehydratase family glycyl radical enzyme [Erysipelotrichaceae bacterium]|nr:formate C-acetyltransferase/glycerol dehydratase family glycyl radical enzyme [Erysipelotrichaceae bacterium]